MGSGMSVNNSIGCNWYNQILAQSQPQNTWSYSIFPSSMGSNIKSPCTDSSSMNDSMVMGYDGGASSMLNGVTDLMKQFMPAMQAYQAQQAEAYKKIMESIQGGNTNINVDGTSNPTGKKEFKESDIRRTLIKMGTGDSTKDRLNATVEWTSKGQKFSNTLLRRLLGLVDQYNKTPEKAFLNEENYKIIWEIAAKYAETGELSTEDNKTLREIAMNPSKSAGAAGKKEEEGDVKARPAANELERAKKDTPDSYETLAGLFNQSLNSFWNTDTDIMYDDIKPKVNANNVLELANNYDERFGCKKQESLVEAIFRNCDGWGCGESMFGANDAKPHVDKLNAALIERAKAFVKENGEESGIKSAEIPSTLIDKSDRKKTAENFKALQEKLTKAEKEVYGD